MTSAAAKSPEELFRSNAVAVVQTLSDLAVDLAKADLITDVDEDQLEGLADAVECAMPVDLVMMFVRLEEEVWPRIMARDIQFFCGDILTIFGELPEGMEVLAEPVKIYLELKADKHSKKFPDPEKWPIKADDIECLWAYCNKLLRDAYKFCLSGRHLAAAKADEAQRARKKLPPRSKTREINVELYRAHVEAFEASLQKSIAKK